MTISFGGLASGVDTSSWIEALVSMKQASLKTYEQKKEVLEQTTSILDNVKNFFNSFKGVLSNVTNSNLGITSFDLFIQKLVDTTNAEVVTANVTTEAQEASYEVNVEQVATATEAKSSFLTTLTTTTESIATHSSLLSSIGIGTGEVGVIIGGVERKMTLQSNDTISSLIDKLNRLGVDASYDAQYGYFSVNLGLEDINDTYSNTGIKDAFFLTNVNSGYASDLLELLSTFTNVITATENSKMSDFGVTNGEYIVTDASDINNFTTHTIDVNKTFREFFDELQLYGFDAGFNDDGSITMVANGGYLLSGALAEALELVTLDNSEQTTTKASSTVSAYSTETINIDFTSTLGDIGAVTSDNDKLVILDRNYNTIKEITTLGKDSTIDDLFGELAKYGISGAIEGNFITLNAKTGNIISGSIAENMGIDTFVDSTTTIKAGNSTTSTSLVSYVASATDWVSDCLWDVWDSYSDADKVITVSHTDRYGTDKVYTYTVIEKNSIAPNGAVLRGTQFQDIINWFNDELDTTSTLKFNENGQIYIDSNDCFYFEGTIADYLGLSTYKTTYTWTEGITTTQSTDTLSFRVRKTDYIADTLWDNGWLNYTDDQKVISAYHSTVDHVKDGVTDPTFHHTVVTLVGTFTIKESQTVVGADGITTTIVQGTTFEDLTYWYTTQIDTTATFLINNDGTITIDSNDTFKLEGQAITDLGLGVSSYHQVWTTGIEETQSSATIKHASKMTDYIMDTYTASEWSKVNKTISVYTTKVDHIDGSDGNGTYQVTIQSKLTDIVINENTTFNKLAEQLRPYDIELTIDENGVLKLNSTKANFLVEEGFYSEKVNNVNYASGTLSMLDHFGVQYDTVTQSWTTGLTTTESTTDVSYVARWSDYISDSFRASEWFGNSSHGAVNKDIIIYHATLDHSSQGTVITETTRTTITDQTTFEDLRNFLAQNSITMTMTDGVIGLDSANYFIAGERYTGGSKTNNTSHYGEQVDDFTGLWTNGIMNHFGGYSGSFYTTFDTDRTSYSTVNQNWTTGIATTQSTGDITYKIKLSDYVSDTFTASDWNGIDKTIYIVNSYLDHNTHEYHNQTVGSISIDSNTTFEDMQSMLAAYGVEMDIVDGVITLDSDNRNYITGEIPSRYGLTFDTITQYWTTGTAGTSSNSEAHYDSDNDDLIKDLYTASDWSSVDKTLYIKDMTYDFNSHSTSTNTVGSIYVSDGMTISDLASQLSSYGISLDVSGGRVTMDSSRQGCWVDGEIADTMGLSYNTETLTHTIGIDVTSDSAITYDFKGEDTIYELLHNDWGSLDKTLRIYQSLGTFDRNGSLITGNVLKDKYVVDENTTFNDIASWCSSYNVNLGLSNSTTSASSDQNCYMVGDIAYALGGLSYTDTNYVFTYGVNTTSSEALSFRGITNDTKISDIVGWENLSDKNIYYVTQTYIATKGDIDYSTTTISTTGLTIGELNDLCEYITISADGTGINVSTYTNNHFSFYLTGQVAELLDIDGSYNKTNTVEVGKTYTGSQITATAIASSTFTDFVSGGPVTVMIMQWDAVACQGVEVGRVSSTGTMQNFIDDIYSASGGNITGSFSNGHFTFSTHNGYFLQQCAGSDNKLSPCLGTDTYATDHDVVDILSTSGLTYTVTTVETHTEGGTTETDVYKGVEDVSAELNKYKQGLPSNGETTVRVMWTATNMETGEHDSGDVYVTEYNVCGYSGTINDEGHGLLISGDNSDSARDSHGNFNWWLWVRAEDGWRIDNINIDCDSEDTSLSKDPTSYYTVSTETTSTETTVTTTVTTTYSAGMDTYADRVGLNSSYYDIVIGHYESENGRAVKKTETVRVSGADRFSDWNTELEQHHALLGVSNGDFSLTTESGYFIDSHNLPGMDSSYYNIRTRDAESYTESSYEYTKLADEDTRMSELGITSGTSGLLLFIPWLVDDGDEYNSTNQTIDISSSSETIGTFLNKISNNNWLREYGISASISDGRITINNEPGYFSGWPASHFYLRTVSDSYSDVVSKLGLTTDRSQFTTYQTWQGMTSKNSNKDFYEYLTNENMGKVTLSQMGYSGHNCFDYAERNQNFVDPTDENSIYWGLVAYHPTSTVQEILLDISDSFSGMYATLDDSTHKITLSCNNDKGYFYDWGANPFKFGTGYATRNISLATAGGGGRVTCTLCSQTTAGDLGSNLYLDVLVHRDDQYAHDFTTTNGNRIDGTNSTSTYTWYEDQSLQDFVSGFNSSNWAQQYGFSISFNEQAGKLTFHGSDRAYLLDSYMPYNNDFTSVLDLCGNYYTTRNYDIVTEAASNKTDLQTYLNSNSRLSDWGISGSQSIDIVYHTNDNYVTDNDKASGTTNTITVTWSSGETFQEFLSKLPSEISAYLGDSADFNFSGNEYVYVSNISSELANILNLSTKENGTYGTSYGYTINYKADADNSAEYCYLNERNTMLHNMSINSDQTMTFVVHTNNTFAEANTDASSVSGINNVTSTITVTWTTSETLQQFEDKINAELAALHSSVGAPNNVEGNYSISFSVDPNTGKWSFTGNEYTYVEDISSELANFTQLSTKENGTYGTSYNYSMAYRANADNNKEYTFLNKRNTKLSNLSINSDQTLYYVVHTHNTFVQDFTGEVLDEATLAVHNGNQVDTNDLFLYDNNQRGSNVNNQINSATTHTYTIGIAWTTGETLQQYEDKVHSTLASLYNSINALRTSEPLNIDSVYDVAFSIDAENGKLSFTGNEYTYVKNIGDQSASQSTLENKLHIQENSTGTYGTSYNYNINYRPDTDTNREYTYLNLRNSTLANMSIFSDQTIDIVLHVNNTYAQDTTKSTIDQLRTSGNGTVYATTTIGATQVSSADIRYGAYNENGFSSSTKLRDLGLSNATFTMGNGRTYTINSSDSIASALQNAGLEISIYNDRIAISGDAGHYITGMSNNLQNALNIHVGENYTYTYRVDATVDQGNLSEVTRTVTVTWTYGALNTSVDMDNSNPNKPETFGEFIADIYRTLAAETTRYADQNLDVNFGFSIGTDKNGSVDMIGNQNSNAAVADTLGLLMENGKLNESKLSDFINKNGALDGDGYLRFRGNEFTYVSNISDELAAFLHVDNRTKENGTYGTSYEYDIDYANNSNNQTQYTYMNYDKARLQDFDLKETQYITIVTNNNTTFSADSTKNGTVLIDNTNSTYVIEWTIGKTGHTKNADGSYNNNDNGIYDGETFAEFIYELEHFGVVHNLDTDASKVLGNDIYKINVTINPDKTISLVGNEYTYIAGISDDLQKIFKIDSYHTEDQVLVAENGIHLNEATKLSELGLSNENFTMNDGRVINISANDSIVNKLRSAGLNVNVSDDKIVIDGNSGCFIKKVSTDLSDALNFKIGDGYYYSTYDYDLYFTGGKKNDYYDSAYQAFNHDIEFTTHKDKDGFDNSNGEVYTDQVNLTILNYDTRLDNLSILSNMTMTLETPEGGKSIEIDHDETIQQLKERLFSDYGIDVTVDKKGGLLTFTPTRADEGYYIVGIDTEFKDKFFIQTGENGTYTVNSEYSYETDTPGVYATAYHTVTAEHGTYATSTIDNYSNTNSRSLDYTDDHLTTKLSTRLSKINGYNNGNGKIRVHYSDGFEQDVDLKSSMTIGQMCDVLADYGVKAEVLAGGRITFSSENGTYLKSIDGGSNLLEILNMSDFDITVEGNTVINSKTLSQTVETTTTYFASEDTLLSEYAEGLLEANGVITFLLNDKYKSVTITSDDTFGTLIDKFKEKGLQSKIVAGVFSVSSGFDSFSIVQEATTSNIGAILKFGERKDLGGYAMTDRSKTVISKTTSSETNSISVSNYADSNTTFDTFNIIAGSLSVYKDGQKALVQISGADTAKTLQDKLRNAYGQNVNGSDEDNICVKYIDGNLKIFQANTSVIVGSNEDSSNFAAITGIMSDAYFTNIAKDENNTKMEAFNIETGSLSVIKEGQKAQIQVSESDTAKTLQDKLRRAYGQDINGSDEDNICVKYIDGKMKIYQNDNDVIVGSYDDTSNISAVMGMMESSNIASSTRKFYKVNENSKVTDAGLFRNGDVTTGEFVVGDATITISEDTTIKDILTQINTNPEANAIAYWDSIDGEFVIKSKTTGDFYINVEANNSNFTDIMGLTNSTYDSDHVATSSTINTASQVHGKNARLTINGATYTSTSNTIGSDVTGLEGLTINVKNMSTDGPTVLTVKKDVQSLALAVSDVIDAYNELIDNINSALTSKSELQNDSDLKRLRNQIKSIMTSSVKNSSPFKNIVSIGIVTNAADPTNLTVGSGIYKLSLDVEKFAQAFEADSEGVRTFLIGKVNEDGELIEDGILTRIEALIDEALTGASGYFERTEDSIDKQLDRVEAKIVKGNAAIEKYREKLEKKYMSMNILNGNIQTQYQVYFK